jgi:predicted hydrolase (HD superfamily)
VGLLLTNFKQFYKSSKLLKENWVKELLNMVNKDISYEIMAPLFVGKNNIQKDCLNWKHILNLLDSILFCI